MTTAIRYCESLPAADLAPCIRGWWSASGGEMAWPVLLPGIGAELYCSVGMPFAGAGEDQPGTLFYAVHRQEGDAEALVLYELYRDRAAWEAHMALPAVQVVLQQFDALLVQPPRLVFCEPLAWSGMKPLPLLPE